MGKTRAGFHAGRGHAKSFKADGKYVQNSIWIPANQFQTTYISGSAASVSSITATAGSGRDYTYAFNPLGIASVGFTFIVPGSVKAGTRADATIYWTSSGVGANQRDVIWDIDYTGFTEHISGSEVFGTDWILSGTSLNSLANATASGANVEVSGSLSRTTVKMAGSTLSPYDYVRCQLYRDTDEEGDNLLAPAHVLGVLLEFTD